MAGGNVKDMKHIMILLSIIILTVSFYSCRINKSKENQAINGNNNLDVIIKNNSSDTYYFNISDIEHPSCFVNYVDSERKIKEFNFSMKPMAGDIKNDITIWPSSFSYKLDPADEIKLMVKLKQGFDDYYKVDIDKTNFAVTEKLIGKALEKYFYIYCSREMFSYNGWLSDYSEKINEYGIKLQGAQTTDKTIVFEIK